ncbi:hypothetical protein [Roseovarius aestuariivivens]|uniref:hypothetical protein n=1 Tax=Roseovarius aestuariivivens TaxID=1888910 RepID=UPI00107FDF7E|nr:hypothetical protein [Roseovarius aestuariivivens]
MPVFRDLDEAEDIAFRSRPTTAAEADAKRLKGHDMTHRTFISIILAAALAVTGMSAAPARADNKDVAKWIAGAVALGVIGAAIAEDRKRDRRRNEAVARQRTQWPYYNQYGTPTRRYDDDRRHHGHHKNKGRHGHDRHDGYRRDARLFLPDACRVQIPTRNGTVRGYGRRCLINSYPHFNALPHQCARRVHGDRGRVVYGGRCLRQNGYRTAFDHK